MPDCQRIKILNFNTPNLILSREWQLILFFVSVKLLIHFLTFSNFELHRDAYLYYALSENLDWGYVEVPPFIAFIGQVATSIFGNTVFGLRFFPAVIGAVNLLIIGLAVKELGGNKIAITLASLAYILSPAYLHTNTLFQPVCFDHFFWLLSGYLILLLIKRNNPKIWIWIAVVSGLAFLNKYIIVFFYAAFAISLLISNYRYLYKSEYFIISLFAGLIIIFPNLVWQYQHNWPVLQHMSELHEKQLIHVQVSDFIIEQFLMNIQALFIWVFALLALLFFKKERQFRLFGFTSIIVFVLLIIGKGKSYYTLGIYPMLFVFGAYFIEKYTKRYLPYIFSFLVISMFTFFYFSLSFSGIPLSSYEKIYKEGAFRWEDGAYHDIPQDMADMTGWKEIGQKVAEIYLSLDIEKRNNCDIFCDNYGQAGAIMFYGKDINIPQPISFSSSFALWVPDSLTKNIMIWVYSPIGNENNADSLLTRLFKNAELKITIDNKYFREDGTKIYFCEFPTDEFNKYYKSRINELNYRKR